jgi:hypothetical protein
MTRGTRYLRVRLVALVLLAGCFHSVDYKTLPAGKFTTDPLNTPDDMRGIELTLDLVNNRGELRDGPTVVPFTLARHADRDTWAGGCGHHGGSSMLEVADLSPHTFQLRGRTLSFKQVRADCFSDSVWLWTDYTSDRLIFKTPPSALAPRN